MAAIMAPKIISLAEAGRTTSAPNILRTADITRLEQSGPGGMRDGKWVFQKIIYESTDSRIQLSGTCDIRSERASLMTGLNVQNLSFRTSAQKNDAPMVHSHMRRENVGMLFQHPEGFLWL